MSDCKCYKSSAVSIKFIFKKERIKYKGRKVEDNNNINNWWMGGGGCGLTSMSPRQSQQQWGH